MREIMLGIIGAMSQEVEALKHVMEDAEIRTRAGMDFYRGAIRGRKVTVVRSGIGKVNAAVCCQILADCYGADAVINTGIAGSLRPEIRIGDIVLSEDALQHDMDATGFGYPAGVIPQADVSVFPGDRGLIRAAKASCERVNPGVGVHVGRVVSGDQFISDSGKKAWLRETFRACCAEMEGAAVAQTAWLNGLPFLIIRAISDQADDSAGTDYAEFEAKAIEHSVRLLLDLIRSAEESFVR